jgi:Tannase-like family of unknown function (DUF6351)
MKYYHFSTRERLIKANGHADNMVMWNGVTEPRVAFGSLQAFLMMTAWLDNVAADISGDPLAVKVVRNKPPDLSDGCWTGTSMPFTFIAEPQFLGGPGTSVCNNLYPGYLFPRYMAGMPLANDVVKCRLRRIDLADYAVTFTPEEVARLNEIFPDGVCDYSRRGLEQRDLLDVWLTYTGVGEYRKDRNDTVD